MEDDHFSPVVGSIFPEILGASTGRADALIASFRLSTAARNAAAGRALAGPFAQHWAYDPSNKNGPNHSLRLWCSMQLGWKRAFVSRSRLSPCMTSTSCCTPFRTRACPTKAARQNSRKIQCFSLIDAAAVSARFPLVLPPFSAEMRNDKGSKRWNFVDGGYTDNSGATTALDLYEVLKKVAKPDQVNLQIILVTSSTLQPDLNGTDINGTVFRDTLAPIDALMNVREDLGNDAVARACSEVYRDDSTSAEQARNAENRQERPRRGARSNQGCIGHAGQSDAHLHVVEIQDQTYGLALGWKISQTSFSVVSWMLGDAAKCPPPASPLSSPGGSDRPTVGGSGNDSSLEILLIGTAAS